MNARDAKRELKANINLNFSHAVLLRDKSGSWRTELHGGHAGNCCCNEHKDFIWREESPYTDPVEVDELFARSAAAAAMGRSKSPRKAASSRENGKKGGRPKTNEMPQMRLRVDTTDRQTEGVPELQAIP